MSLASDLVVLRRVAPFANLTDEQLRLVAFSGERVLLSAGEVLLDPAEPPPGAYVVLAGGLDVRATGCRQPQAAGPGAIVGLLSLFAEADLGLAVAARAASELLLIRRSVFRRLLEEYPEAAIALHARLSAELVDLGEQVAGVRRDLDSVTTLKD